MSTLADRLRDGPRPTPAEVLRAARDVALGLDALHTAGLLHGQVEAAGVELHPDGQARLVVPPARPAGTPRPGDGRRGDLRDLGRLLELTLPVRSDGEGWGGDGALAAEGRAVARWLLDPGPGGAATAGDAASALAKVLGGGVFAPPPGGSARGTAPPLAPHRVALRAGCQGTGVGVVAALVSALGGELAVSVGVAVGWAVGGVASTLAEELARGRPDRGWPAAVLFGALAPAAAIVSGGVAGSAVAHFRLPVEVLQGLVSGTSGRLEAGAVFWPTVLFFFPGVAFARARLRGGRAVVPAVQAGLAATIVMLCLTLVVVISAPRAEVGMVLGVPVMAGLATTAVALLAGTGLVLGRVLEERLLRSLEGRDGT